MKVGILTFYNTTNYGASLQAFALYKKLSEFCLCDIVRYHCQSIEQREFVLFPRFELSLYRYLRNWKYFILFWKRKKSIKKFLRDYASLSPKEYCRNNLHQMNEDYDVFIVGSDMVWEQGITNCDYTFFLDFAPQNKKYSYAASIGKKNIENEKKVVPLWNDFSQLSVREISTFDTLKKYCTNPIRMDLDPTLLFDSVFWEKYEDEPKEMPQNFLLLYMLDGEGVMLSAAMKYAKELNLELVLVSEQMRGVPNCKIIRGASVGCFLRLLHKASLVITGSYHGLLFSLNYNTPFYYFNRANGSRMESIAKIFGMENRNLSLQQETPNYDIDFTNFNTKIQQLRTESESYLKSIVR